MIQSGTKSYNGYYGCVRYTQEGVYDKNRMTYPALSYTKLTNDSFRQQALKKQHNSQSAFVESQIDMIDQFSLGYLHTVCLGVVKKFMYRWLKSSDVQFISKAQPEMSHF